MRGARALLAALALGAAPLGAHATTAPTLTLAQQARKADVIVRATLGTPTNVTEGEATWLAYPLTVTETVAGDPASLPQRSGRPVLYVLQGLEDLPELRAGQDAFLLLYSRRMDNPVVGFAQGVYPIVNGRVTRASGATGPNGAGASAAAPSGSAAPTTTPGAGAAASTAGGTGTSATAPGSTSASGAGTGTTATTPASSATPTAGSGTATPTTTPGSTTATATGTGTTNSTGSTTASGAGTASTTVPGTAASTSTPGTGPATAASAAGSTGSTPAAPASTSTASPVNDPNAFPSDPAQFRAALRAARETR